VQKINTEIQSLNRDTIEQTNRIALIKQGIQSLKEENDKNCQNKD
jgi:hypothetical protein